MCKRVSSGLFFIFFIFQLAAQQKSELHTQLFSFQKAENETSGVQIDPFVLKKIRADSPLVLLVPVSIDKEVKNLVLRKHDIYRDHTFLHYRGRIENNSSSRVYLSIDVEGIRLSIHDGNTSISLVKDQDPSILNYSWATLPKKIADTYPQCTSQTDLSKSQGSPVNAENNSEVEVYIEVDYDMYLSHNSSVTEVMNYTLSVFEEVAHWYANENIPVIVSEIKVWTSPDPYNDNSSLDALNSFRNILSSNFNGDLAHLISGSSNDNGGKAFIDVLCDKSKAFAYSNFRNDFSGVNDFSWDVFLMAHEMGHNLGSRHTHECAWGPSGNMALDQCEDGFNCDVVAGSPGEGTIMSYCHDDMGINFEAGFGTEPGNLIRSRHQACHSDEGTLCNNAIELTYNGKYMNPGAVKGFGSSQTSADHSVWYTFTAPSDGRIKIFNCYSGVDSRLWVHAGSCEDLEIIANSDDDCGPEGNQPYSSNIPHLKVSEGETLFFEWDDRWSRDGFEFWFKFGSSHMENVSVN